ncbi:hypothetical protein [Vibrio algivorus]|uniref:DUF1845 domain-containing protein n=1 Tax=Vibrio algivorus TaxID=1667024 RepID=A0A557PGX3_9VIBR|nr:hypothetical protein [Vibrio algivorus]TVO39901.1 hypothetical protein FOF44_00070 [Vibrio algivorus]
MKNVNPTLNLHTQKLATIWSPEFFHKNKVKYASGDYIFNCLFTVSCYATNRKIERGQQEFARQVCQNIIERMDAIIGKINKMKQGLEEQSGDSLVRNFEPENEFVLPYDASRLGRENTKLLKVFMTYNQYFLTLNRLRYDEEITIDYATNQRNNAYNLLLTCLGDLNVMCIEYHKIRKAQ